MTLALDRVETNVSAFESVTAPTLADPQPERHMARRFGLSDSDMDEIGRRFDAIAARERASFGQEDVDYLQRVMRWRRGLATGGRAALFLGFLPPFWIAGTASLALAKILDNMEIGHNVLHGQYDWTRDPALSSQSFDWDASTPALQWQRSHNYRHHTWTNVVGEDRDIGYGILRVNADQEWSWASLGNPLYAIGLALVFDYGIMFHDAEFSRYVEGERSWDEARPELIVALKKAGRQAIKDYVLWPALTGPLFFSTLLADLAANVIRNVWSFGIIFCGHFPDGVVEFTKQECENETRGHWYFRQMLGSANIRGGRLFHIMSGNLSFQIEHHLFPDIPARRYQRIAPEIEAICAEFGLPYNTGRFSTQLGSVARKIGRFALPGGQKFSRTRHAKATIWGGRRKAQSTPRA